MDGPNKVAHRARVMRACTDKPSQNSLEKVNPASLISDVPDQVQTPHLLRPPHDHGDQPRDDDERLECICPHHRPQSPLSISIIIIVIAHCHHLNHHHHHHHHCRRHHHRPQSFISIIIIVIMIILVVVVISSTCNSINITLPPAVLHHHHRQQQRQPQDHYHHRL